jgi:hypothetical protein
MTKLLALTTLLTIFLFTSQQTVERRTSMKDLPPGYWPIEKSQPIIDKTQTIRLSPDLSLLSAGESKAVMKLLEVGKLFQSIYEEQRHPQALLSARDLQVLDKRAGSSAATQNLLALYRLNQGPIAATLDNKREPFLPVGPRSPEKNVYPPGVRKEMIETFLAAHPEKRETIMHSRTVVRRAIPGSLQRDLSVLKMYPVLDTLHPGLKAELEGLLRSGEAPERAHSSASDAVNEKSTAAKEGETQRASQSGAFYAVPYSVAYAEQLMKA